MSLIPPSVNLFNVWRQTDHSADGVGARTVLNGRNAYRQVINRILMVSFFFLVVLLYIVFFISGDVVSKERLPFADSGTRRVLQRRTVPCARTNAIYSGDELKSFKK